jgi:hypothetical protein
MEIDMKSLIKLTALAAVGLAVVMFLFGSVGFRDTGVAKQNDLQSAYNINRTHLASYARQIETDAGLAKLNIKGNTEFMEAAVSGRYKQGNSADANKTGTLFSAMHEAYPTLPENMYPAIMKSVEVQEALFKNDQDDLSGRINSFDTWTQTTFHALYGLLPWCHFPNDHLTALGPDGKTLHGAAALDQMRSLVTSKESDDAYHSNQFNGVQLPQ